MSIPMIRAIKDADPGGTINVLVGSGPDDAGARDVFKLLKKNFGVIGEIHVDRADGLTRYDHAIMAIPYDGRWRNNYDYVANNVMDSRPRPDPETFGFSSWYRHEVAYQMENAFELGYDGLQPWPGGNFLNIGKHEHAFLGIGYKRDVSGFWKIKHWGNENYAAFLNKFMRLFDGNVMCTGNQRDFAETINPIKSMLDEEIAWRFHALPVSLEESFNLAGSATLYVGNDTGMMHVACAHSVPALGLFFMENAITKNGAWGPDCINIDAYNRELSVDEVLSNAKELLK